MSLRLSRLATVGALLLFTLPVIAVLPPRATAADRDTERARIERAAALKRVQQQLLAKGARRHLDRARTVAEARRRHQPPPAAATGRKVPLDWREADGPQGSEAALRYGRYARPASVNAGILPNVRVNDPTGDVPNAGQSEAHVAAWNQYVLAAWNDGQGLTFTPYRTAQGYGYSTDGGATFTDGGEVPIDAVAPAETTWTSDPVVSVNEKTGEFWYCGMFDISGTFNGVAVRKATFNGSAIQWGPLRVVRRAGNTQLFFDKPWMVVDSVSSRVYVTYSTFSTTGDTIDFQRSNVGVTGFDNPLKLSSGAESGLVQGSRPVVGPAGELYVVWYSINLALPYDDFFRIRKSTDQGANFGAAVNAARAYINFGSGAPGFNRELGIGFPSVAVDRSTGAHRGRIYVGWNESIDFYDDDLGLSGNLNETEANDLPATANTFTMGQSVKGFVSTTSDFDYWKFTGTAGQTVILFADTVAATLDMSLRLFCADGSTHLAFSAPGAGGNNLIVFTLPVAGTYYLRMASFSGTGRYSVQTGFDVPTAGERARDHRDCFTTWSDNGSAWATPVRLNDSPAGYDDWLPELAVGGDHGIVGKGVAYGIWFDWRDSPADKCGGLSNIYLSRSEDGGQSWLPVGLLSDAQTNWSQVASNIAPNQGDYLGLFANAASLYAVWGDGRNGNPDVYAAIIPLQFTPTEVALASARAEPDRVTLVWYAGARSGFTATVERRAGSGAFAALGQAAADGTGQLAFVDRDVAPGARYAYRLTWDEGGTRRASPETWVTVPLTADFSLQGARPNPAAPSGVFVTFSLPDARSATLELLDVSGRRLADRLVTGAGAQVVNLAEGRTLEPGVYLVRLTQGGRSLTARVSIVR